MLRWFDRWLKGVDNGVDDDPRVQLFVMGGGGGEKTPSGHLLHGGFDTGGTFVRFQPHVIRHVCHILIACGERRVALMTW